MTQHIPRATALRLPVYYRYLRYLQQAGKKRVSSTELSEAVKVDSATIRRDFSYFGALGKRGYGYNVDDLTLFFAKILNHDELTTVALIGVGNLGHALLNYNFSKSHNIRIGLAFDIRPDLVNTEQNGIPVYHCDELEKRLKENHIETVILTVSEGGADEIVDRLIKVGIKGILNFTPLRFEEPPHMRIQNVDLTNELQTLVYFIDNDPS